jgi:hypothetical protein
MSLRQALSPAALATAALAVISWSPALAEAPAIAPAGAEALWDGVVIVRPGQAEAPVTVELARDAGGALVGTLDMPSHGLSYAPLSDVRQDGTAVTFAFSRYSPTAQADVRSVFSGEIAADGTRIEGTFLEGDKNRYPFVLERVGEPGSERRQPPTSPLVALSDSGEELKASFNRDGDKLRLLVLVSPTCPVCLMTSRLLHRYVLRPLDDERLRVYLVWGPMQHKETAADAEQATATLSDPRATHFWTDDEGLARAFQGPLAITGEPAWDTYMIFPPGARWEDGPPTPAFFMHIDKPLPPEQRFDAHVFAAEVRRRLSGG